MFKFFVSFLFFAVLLSINIHVIALQIKNNYKFCQTLKSKKLSILHNDKENLLIKWKKVLQTTTIGVFSLILPMSFTNSAIADTNKVLTANELIQSDIQPRIMNLKDINTVLNQANDLVLNKDYLSIRRVLRSDPCVQLRKTARYMKKYLTSEKQTLYEQTYQNMISAVDDLDTIALKRTRDENLSFKNDVIDTESKDALSKLIFQIESLIQIAEEE